MPTTLTGIRSILRDGALTGGLVSGADSALDMVAFTPAGTTPITAAGTTHGILTAGVVIHTMVVDTMVAAIGAADTTVAVIGVELQITTGTIMEDKITPE